MIYVDCKSDKQPKTTVDSIQYIVVSCESGTINCVILSLFLDFCMPPDNYDMFFLQSR